MARLKEKAATTVSEDIIGYYLDFLNYSLHIYLVEGEVINNVFIPFKNTQQTVITLTGEKFVNKVKGKKMDAEYLWTLINEEGL